MKPILHNVQTKILEFLKTQKQLENFTILPCGLGSLENLHSKSLAAAQGMTILLSHPLPTKLVENISGPCFEQIEFQVAIGQDGHALATSRPLDTAETLSHLLSHHPFKEELWSGAFALTLKSPWKEIQSVGHRQWVQVHFISVAFNTIFA